MPGSGSLRFLSVAVAKHGHGASQNILYFQLRRHFHHMINDVFGGESSSHNRFLVENLIVKGIIPERQSTPQG